MDKPIEIGDDETLDVLFNEKLFFIQKKEGYRFSIDSILLCNFVELKEGDRVLEIGSGCGIIPIYLTFRGFKNRFLGVEIQEELYRLSEKNKIINRCENVQFIHGDIRVLKEELKKEPFDVIISNPPYTREESGRKSPKKSLHLARYETSLRLEEIMDVGRLLLKFLGRLYLIYPAYRTSELIYFGKKHMLEPKRLRFVHSRAEEEANLVLADLRKGAKTGVRVERPLYVYSGSEYTEEVKTYYEL
ncbi:MAG: methyltransferase [Desulfobacterota bacterium]|nr:methyltransferase [Thermodesulfobacteriota bacterium]MDW8001661.1 methyltransferase [Deltaproteobacteria bacterium]